MLPVLHSSSLPLCDGLYDFMIYFGGEREGLPHDCRQVAWGDRPMHKSSGYQVTLNTYRKNLQNPDFVPGAIRMALVIGSLVFTINHGEAFLKQEMTRNRWVSASLSFVMPYLVSIYGQTQCQLKSRPRNISQ